MTAEILVVGLSHHTAPVEIRERLSVTLEQVAAEVQAAREASGSAEMILLSTCNRVELYAVAADTASVARGCRSFLSERAKPDGVDRLLYTRSGEKAVHHAFRVAASLDSMIVGEPQILGQVKEAFAAAEGAGTVGTLLGRCFSRAFAVAKRVRAETEVAAGSVSVSSIAIDLASKIFGSLEGRSALLVGAGSMAEGAAKSLAKHGARLTIANRSPERGQELAKACGGTATSLEHLSTELEKADVVISSTASDKFVLTRDQMRSVIKGRKRRPLFIIDIAVPRDVEPSVGDMPNVFLYDVDDLEKVAGENAAARRKAATKAEAIVSSEVSEFERWRRSLVLTPTIVALRKRFHEVVRAELEHTLPRMRELSESDRKHIEAMAEAMANKLLHSPVTQLKDGAGSADTLRLIDATRQLFALPPEREPEEEGAAESVPSLAPAGGQREGS